MNCIYNAIIAFINIFFKLLQLIPFIFGTHSKLGKFVMGQKNLFSRIEDVSEELKKGKKRIWIHAASLGEYGVARPIIKRLKQECECTIILTFFSSTGYEAVCKNPSAADYVFYLPLDTPHNAKRFLNLLSPHQAIFIISEYWPNYLTQLKKRSVPTYIISAIINSNSIFFRWYGKMFVRSLSAFSHFFVLNKESQENLISLGYSNSTVSGDPLFDNIQVVTNTPYSNPVIERFIGERNVFIAGSISDKNDMALVCNLANNNPDTCFIFVPHEITDECLNEMETNLAQKSIAYSKCSDNTDFSEIQTLVIDYVGELAYMYRYAKWAYVGGGFTPYLHSIIEATAYGVPVAFGPKTHRKVTPTELVKAGIGCIVHTPEELDNWFKNLKDNNSQLKEITSKALEYAGKNSGATLQIVNELMKNQLI